MQAYREQPGRVGARVVAWPDLGRDTRERLGAACQGEGAVPLLASVPALQPAVGAAGALAVVSSAVLAGVLGFVVRVAPSVGESAVGIGASAVLGGGVATQVGLAARSWWLRGRRSFAGGAYLFARDLIEVRGRQVRVVPTSLLTGVEYLPGVRQHGQGQVELRFEGGERHVFDCDAETGNDLEGQLRRLQGALDEASQAGDLAMLERLDPLWAERPRWSGAAASARGRPAPGWLLAPWPALAMAAALGAAGGAALIGRASSHGERLSIAEALARQDVVALERIAREGGDGAGLAESSLDDLALRAPGPDALLRRLQRHRTPALDAAAFERARDADGTLALWTYLSVGGLRGSEAEALILERTLRSGSFEALDDYTRRGGPARAEVAEARQRLVLATATRDRDLRALQRLSDDPQPSPVKDEARRELRRIVAAEGERLRAAHPGPLGALFGATLARQGASGGPLRIIVRGEAPDVTRRSGDRTVPADGLDDVVRDQLSLRLTGAVPLELLRLERQRYARDGSAGRRQALQMAGSQDELPPPESTYLLLTYALRPSGPERVDAQLTIELRSPGSLAVAPVELRFASVNPAVRGDRMFADELAGALEKALGAPAAR